MAFLEFIGAAILIIAILVVAFWVGLREQGFLRNISRRSQANTIAARERADRYRAQPQYGPPPGQYGPPQYGQPQYGPPPGQYGPPPGGQYGPPPSGQYGPPPEQHGQPGQYGPPQEYGGPQGYGPPPGYQPPPPGYQPPQNPDERPR
jgi:hypothetical protein